MKKVNYLQIVGFAVLYPVTVFATAFLGFLSPFAWVFYPVIAALLGAFSYLLVAVRWQKFGVGTLLALLLGAFLLAIGECDLSKSLLILLTGVLSDIVRQFVGHTSSTRISLAYPVLALGPIAWLIPLWTRTESYCQGATDELGANYAEGLRMCSSPWGLFAVVALTLIVGFIGIRLAAKILRVEVED